jgi:4-oxalocrotonate tautomerase
MPVINLNLGKISNEQKKELVTTLTKNVSEITHLPKEIITVLIHELEMENIGFAGKWLGKEEEENK